MLPDNHVPDEGAVYVYRGTVYDVYDGDTIRVDVELGFYQVAIRQRFRLFGINTPEVRGEERQRGIEVRDYVRSIIPKGTEVIVQTIKDKTGKYGRWLAVIWVESPGGWVNVNQHLLEHGMAEELNY